MAAGIILLLIICLHVGLVNAGQWESDEYQIFTSYHACGYRELLTRIVRWSPRPFSEGLLYLYYLCIQWLHVPLTGLFLLLCWLALMAATLAGAGSYWQRFTDGGQWLFPYRIVLSLSLMAMFLLGHSIYDMFYWPAAAAAYLSTLAAITFFLFHLLRMKQPRASDTVMAAAALLVACMSSEMGALFVLCYSLLELCVGVRQKKASLFQWMCRALPLCACLLFLTMLMLHRVGGNEFVYDTAIRRNALASTQEGLIQFAIDWLDPRGISERDDPSMYHDPTLPGNIPAIIQAIIVKLFFFLGFRTCWNICSPLRCPAIPLLVFSVALMLTCGLSLIAAEYQFGGVCCSRHETLRQCFYILALGALAIASLGKGALLPPRHQGTLAPLWLLIPALLLFIHRIAPLAEDYSNYSRFTRMRESAWQSGMDPHLKGMVLTLAPPAHVVNGMISVYEGTYSLSSSPPVTIDSVLQFFGKQTIRVLPPL